MSEFLDFLKYKFAYVSIGEFKPGKFEEAEKLYQQAVATYSQGFKRAYLLREPGTDKGISVIIWENQEDMEANKSAAYEEILHKMSHLFAKPPISTFYEISSEILPKNNQDSLAE